MGTIADKLTKLQETKSALKTAINGSGSTVGDKFSDYPVAVTNGKASIASAITEKGVATAADATFDVMAENIRAIKSGGNVCNVTYTGSIITTKIVYCSLEGSIKNISVGKGEKIQFQCLEGSMVCVVWLSQDSNWDPIISPETEIISDGMGSYMEGKGYWAHYLVISQDTTITG